MLGIVTNNCINICDSYARDIFLGVLYGYKMLLQIFSLLLAFSIRKINVKGLNDAKYIAVATYVISIVLAVIIVASYLLTEWQHQWVYCSVLYRVSGWNHCHPHSSLWTTGKPIMTFHLDVNLNHTLASNQYPIPTSTNINLKLASINPTLASIN